jgi:hypothetical protein
MMAGAAECQDRLVVCLVGDGGGCVQILDVGHWFRSAAGVPRRQGAAS